MKIKKEMNNARRFRFLMNTDFVYPILKGEWPDKCVEWLGGKNNNGYGRFRLVSKSVLAHRISWSIFRGNIPNGKYVLHKCDNRKCVNPKHLWLGTRKENQKDMKNKGRAASGERNYFSKLKESQVLEILDRLGKGCSQIQLAKEFRVTVGAINLIKKGKNWSYLSDRIL